MLARARPRDFSLARRHCLQQRKPRHHILNKSRTLTRDSFGQQSASNKPASGVGAGWQQEAGGGGRWRQSGSSRRFVRTFQQVVPLPWLAVACFSAVDLASNAYVVETEDFRRLMQRCNFHITAAEVGDTVDLESLYDLTDWVYESIDAAGPTALPKLLDAEVIGIALRGAGSPDPDISTLCHEMLNVLSSNEHVAAMMANDPSLRAVLVDEVRRQLSGWKTTASGEDSDTVPFAPEQVGDVAFAEGDDVTSISPLRQARHRRRLTGHVNGVTRGVEGRHRLDVGSAGGETAEEDLDHVSDGEPEATEVDTAVGEDPPGTIVLDPFYAALTLRTLSNVMRASRAGAKTPESSTDLFSPTIISDSERRLKIPWPVRLLYGGNDYGEVESDGAAWEASEWPLELKLVGDIAELMLSVSARGDQGVRVVPQEGEGELDEAGQMEARHALQRLEAAAASVLREISSHPKLVGLLMRRRPLFALVTLSWKGQSVKAEDWAAEATLNVCAAYRRLYSVPEPVDKMASHNVVSVLTSWSKRLLAEEKAGTEAAELGPDHEDRAFALQAERAVPPLALSDPLLTITASAVVGLSGIAWGGIRRWVAWRRAGETFAAISRFALPRALLWAGLRAGLGATALTATHGPFGFRSQMRYRTLDATSGNRGTLTMSGVREVADLGYLYVILRLCPYSLLPAFVLNSMLKGGPVAGDAWTG